MRASHQYKVCSQLPIKSRPFSAVTNKSFRREYMKIADLPPFENKDVLWLQTSGWYADIRILLDGGGFSSFGGCVTWQRPYLTFHHDLDLGSGFSEDVGRISLTSYGCIENGVFVKDDKETPFEEKWLCQASAVGSRVLLKKSRNRITGLEVQLGNHCIIILEGTAGRFFRYGSSWKASYRGEGFPITRRPTEEKTPSGWRVVEKVLPV